MRKPSKSSVPDLLKRSNYRRNSKSDPSIKGQIQLAYRNRNSSYLFESCQIKQGYSKRNVSLDPQKMGLGSPMIRGPTLTCVSLPVVNLVDKILNLDIGGVVSGPPHHVLQILAVGTSASKRSIHWPHSLSTWNWLSDALVIKVGTFTQNVDISSKMFPFRL